MRCALSARPLLFSLTTLALLGCPSERPPRRDGAASARPAPTAVKTVARPRSTAATTPTSSAAATPAASTTSSAAAPTSSAITTAAAPTTSSTAAASPPPAATAAVSPTAGAPSTTAVAAAPERSCSEGCFSIERCEADQCVPACPEGEVYIPATGPGGFTMGAGLRKRIDPPHKVVLTRPFCIDATEVTVRAYKACVDAKGCKAPRPWGMWINYPKLLDHPVNKVDWMHAKAYCAWRKQALPTEAQWEWAASGGDNRKWPWGDTPPTCKHADYTPGFQTSASGDDGCHGGGTSPVGSHPDGDRIWPSGKIHDLGGNVWEWVLDNYKPYEQTPQTDPLHLRAETGVHAVRGGGWNRSARGILVHYRGGAVHDYQVPGLGLRCVRNPTDT